MQEAYPIGKTMLRRWSGPPVTEGQLGRCRGDCFAALFRATRSCRKGRRLLPGHPAGSGPFSSRESGVYCREPAARNLEPPAPRLGLAIPRASPVATRTVDPGPWAGPCTWTYGGPNAG